MPPFNIKTLTLAAALASTPLPFAAAHATQAPVVIALGRGSVYLQTDANTFELDVIRGYSLTINFAPLGDLPKHVRLDGKETFSIEHLGSLIIVRQHENIEFPGTIPTGQNAGLLTIQTESGALYQIHLVTTADVSKSTIIDLHPKETTPPSIGPVSEPTTLATGGPQSPAEPTEALAPVAAATALLELEESTPQGNEQQTASESSSPAQETEADSEQQQVTEDPGPTAEQIRQQRQRLKEQRRQLSRERREKRRLERERQRLARAQARQQQRLARAQARQKQREAQQQQPQAQDLLQQQPQAQDLLQQQPPQAEELQLPQTLTTQTDDNTPTIIPEDATADGAGTALEDDDQQENAISEFSNSEGGSEDRQLTPIQQAQALRRGLIIARTKGEITYSRRRRSAYSKMQTLIRLLLRKTPWHTAVQKAGISDKFARDIMQYGLRPINRAAALRYRTISLAGN